MSDNNRTYRIHTEVNKDKFLNVDLKQDYDTLDILSLKINTENVYKLHTSKYGCLVGRVLANGGVGIPNVKLSVFVSVDGEDLNDPILSYLYPYNNVKDKNREGIRYNLLPTSINDKCHQDIGTFPNKRMVLDDNNVLEVYDTYYKYTTTTNSAGDYMIFGLPVGNNIIHTELDLSDIGLLSQKPRDLFYKGYNKTLFENSNQFKKDKNLDSLTQVISQDDSVYVYPFWGDDEVDNEETESQIKITRNDINIPYKFEPTCIFIGSIVSDERSQGFGKRCVPTTRMGKMDRLTTGKGTIEMIRKTPTGEVQSFSVQGDDLIDGNGTWCYQIPMNLDYVKTDEYGNLVPAENESVGIPTRASVRFRISLADYESDSANAHLVKMLVPNNPDEDTKFEPDYNFGTYTRDDSFRDLLWNNVYTVKEYIPRLQHIRGGDNNVGRKRVDRSKNFSGIKVVNANGSNNPIPYNNIRVQLTFLFVFQCIIFKSMVLMVKILNAIIYVIMLVTSFSNSRDISKKRGEKQNTDTNTGDQDNRSCKVQNRLRYLTLDGAMCPSTEGWYMAIGAKPSRPETGNKFTIAGRKKLVGNTINWGKKGDGVDASGQDMFSSEGQDGTGKGDGKRRIDVNTDSPDLEVDGPLRTDTKSAEHKYHDTSEDWKNEELNDVNISASDEYFIKCVELQFAMEYEVIQFDFYNDWLNGCLYIPRWFAELKKRRKRRKIIACVDDENNRRLKNMKLVQQCALNYDLSNNKLYRGFGDDFGDDCGGNKSKCHKQKGRAAVPVLQGNEGGIVKPIQNMDNKYLYYLKPNQMDNNKKQNNLFATDIVLLGSTSECNYYGIPEAKGYPSSTFIMPPPTVQIVDESQEMDINTVFDEKFVSWYNERDKFIKVKDQVDNANEKELSGIDWGYNPFNKDSTVRYNGQRGGHFLEIGCLNSYTNSKSCVNFQRMCELGAEMAQSHYNGNDITTSGMTTGIVTNREVIGNSIRMKFASLNYHKMKINPLTRSYDFDGLIPNSFDGMMGHKMNELAGLYDTNSKSYQEFRFGLNGITRNELLKKFSIVYPNGDRGVMPIFENSFYFYFGLKDGNTAIDRLYTEYFSDCVVEEIETVSEE